MSQDPNKAAFIRSLSKAISEDSIKLNSLQQNQPSSNKRPSSASKTRNIGGFNTLKPSSPQTKKIGGFNTLKTSSPQTRNTTTPPPKIAYRSTSSTPLINPTETKIKPPKPPPRSRSLISSDETENSKKENNSAENIKFSSDTKTDDSNKPVRVLPRPLLSKSSNPSSSDPEQFYRSVRKLTQFPIAAAADKSAIRVLQLDGMDDVEWSKFEGIFSKASEEEPPELKNLFDLHTYDFEVCTRKRIVDKEHQQFLSTLLEDENLNSFSRECVLCFLNNWKIVKGSVFDHSLDKGSQGKSRRIVVNVDKSSKTPRIASPRDFNHKNKEDNTPCAIEPHIFKQSPDEAVASVKEAMDTHLPKHLFKSLHGDIESNLNKEKLYSYLEESEPFNFAAKERLSIEIRDLKFMACIKEPYYCSIAIYDVKKRDKLSETFHFELNEDEYFKLFKKGTSIFCSVTRCLVPLGTHSRADTYIVLRIDKLFSNDIEKDFSRYQKKPKRASTQPPPFAHWKELGFIRQPFAWTAISLYEDGKMRLGSILLDEIYPIRTMWTEDFIYDQLTRDLDAKKIKVIPGSVILDLDFLDTFPPMTVDSSLNFVSEAKNQTKLSKEIEWFGNRNYPFLSYVNNLYVYPQTVVVKHHHPNIRIKVELLEDEGKSPLGVIYTPWGGKPFCREGYTAVCAKEKRPIFSDEIKIQLPGVLTDKHHILFTIMNGTNNEILGYSYTPIYSNTHGIIKNALRTIVIEQQLEPGYLSKEVEPVKISETKKPYLCFKTCIISSIYPESNALFSLSHVLTKNGMVNFDGNPERVLQVIQRLPHALCISFFPAILNCLFKLLASGDPTLSPLAVIGVISVLTKVTQTSNEKSTKCNSMLLSYVRFLFDPIMTARSTVHDSLVHYWCEFIQKERPEVKNLGQGEIWILLNVVLKSSIMKLCETGTPAPDARLTMFSITFPGNLEKLILSLFCVKTEFQNMDVLTMVPLFMKDLLGIIDRGVVFELIFGYISWLNNENQSSDLFLATVKFTFIKIITNYKYYVPLNLPREISIQSSDISEIVHQFWTKHFFAGLILREVRAGLLQKQRIREQAIALLLDLLHSHDTDQRYSDLEKKRRIVGLYFPFVITAVEFQQVLDEYLEPEEKINWLLCFFYIVENCSRKLLHQWWDSCDAERNLTFFKILEMASVVFKGHSLYTPLCFIMVDMILDYITHYEKALLEPNNIELPQIFAVLEELQHNQSVGFVIALYNLLAAISKLYSKPIFCYPSSTYCGSLTYQVLFHCNSEKISVKNKACSLYYYLLKKNFEETNDVERMKLQSTISLCKLLSCEQKVKGYSNLRESLSVVEKYAEQQSNETLKDMIKSAVHQVSRLVRFNEQLAENDQNPQVVAELFIKIAESYYHTPNLHMTWLEALAAHHTKEQAWTEASLVHTQLACIQVEYFLKEVGHFPVDFYSFNSVYPNCKLDSIPKDIVFLDDSNKCSVQNIITHILTAIDLLKKVQEHESTLVLYSMLVEIYCANYMLPEMAECLAVYTQATSSLMKANKDTRLFPTYFRVVFYGKVFGEEDGRQFIYRMEAKYNLMTIQKYLKDIILKTYNTTEEEIEVLGNQAVDKEKLKDNIFYIQVASVQPHKEDDEKTIATFQNHFNVDTFLFESSVNIDGEQCKKKTFFKVRQKFPNISNRLEITSTQEVLLTPLESAIDLIEERVARFKAELNVGSHHDVRINQLQQLLQGSVAPMVHEGPLKICETYLDKDKRDSYPLEQINQLEESMTEFIKLCGFGVKLVNQVIELRGLDEYKQFQEMIESHYKKMRETLKQYILNTSTED